MSNVSTGGISPAFYGLSLEFNRSMDETTGLLSWCILVLGLGVSYLYNPDVLLHCLKLLRTSSGCQPLFTLAKDQSSSLLYLC